MIAAASLALMSAACTATGNAPASRDIPSTATAGALFQPVPHPPVREGDDARQKLAETTAALTIANRRIVGARAWVEDIRGRLMQGARGQ